ncbi:MAG: Rieske 2Fe-2S domain-containing protein [Candidatus Heimdallarchaeota archaeon]|nr:Rieske 2Fe-2S domain-containing protein [Candidatus Heimdallarchaeota archaeon]
MSNPNQNHNDNVKWYKVGPPDLLQVGRITTVQAGHKPICLTRTDKGYGAICNKCPHQGGPLGDGFIDENGYVICPWHAYEFDPHDGLPPGGYDDGVDSFPIEERNDGIYVGVADQQHPETLMTQMVDVMISWGVNSVFGMVGHSNLGLADAMYFAEKDKRLSYYGIRHEGAAAFAAVGYAKLTGRPAACFAIAGPGATNLLTGLWDAHVDRAPVLALTGQVNTQVLGPGTFQEIPLAAAFEAVAEWSQTVLSAANGTDLMALALKHAIVERGVAHLIFPDEVQNFPANENPRYHDQSQRISNNQIQPPQKDLEKAIELINQSKNPAVIIGNGGYDHSEAIIKFAKKIGAPVITTYRAKGAISDSHPLACGVLGRSGTPIASATMVRSDLLIVFGASFSNHTSISVKKTTIQIDFDRMMLGKFHNVDLPIWGEISTAARLLVDGVEGKDNPQRREYVERRWVVWRREKKKRAGAYDETNRIPNAKIMEVLTKLIPDNAVICVDVGNNAYAVGMYFESKSQRFLMSGYLGSIGFGFPASMGAWAAEGDQRKIVAIAGDGGFGQYMAEFTTAVKYKMDITLILLNNNELGKISREQRLSNKHVWQTSLHNPNFADYAENCGGLGIRVEKEADLEDAITKVLNHKGGPSLVEIISTAGQL